MSSEVGQTAGKTACVVCGQEFAGDQEMCPFDGTKLTKISLQLAPGTVLGGRYEIVEAVADGGMGKVYKARHKLMNRTVAIKTMHPFLVASGSALKRFQQEAQAVSQLNHPNILTVFDFFISDDGQPYLVMDYLEGTNLEAVLAEEGQLEPARALSILIMASDGLAHAHEKGVIHRDIKPANIMLIPFAGSNDFVKVVDFGIAKVAPSEGGQSSHLTATGDVFGSPQFMSPEQCRARPLDARSDIYSLGCVMYNALSGKLPFVGQDPIEYMFKQVHETAPLLSTELPPGLPEIVAKSMAKEPADRFQTMRELHDALKSVGSSDFARMSQTSTAPIGAAAAAAVAQSVTSPPASTVSPNSVSATSTVPDLGSATASGLQEPAAPIITIPGLGPIELNQKNVAIAGSATIAILVIAIALLMLKSPTSSSTSAVSGDVTMSEANNSAPVTQQSIDSSSSSTSQSSTSSARAPVKPVASQPTQPAQSTQQVQQPRPTTPAQLYQQYMKYGEQEYKEDDLANAQRYFNAAHNLSENFGEADARFADSLYWQGRVAYKQGSYREALQAYNWVQDARERKYGKESAEAKAVDKDIEEAKRALGEDK